MPAHSRYGSCACCQRRFRSIAARELAEKRAAVLADLKASAVRAAYDNAALMNKIERHAADSASYKQHGAA